MSYTALRLSPLSESALGTPTVSSGMVGYEASWLVDYEDFGHQYLDTGRVTLSSSDNGAQYTDDSGAQSISISTGDYDNMGAAISALVSGMNASGGDTDFSGTWGLDSSKRFRAHIYKASGNFALTISGDANSIFREVLGYGADNLSAGTSHTATLASVTQLGGVRIQYDTLSSSTNFNYIAMVNPQLSPGSHARVVFGTTTTSRDVVIDFTDHSTDTMVTYFDLITYRYVTLELIDPYRQDFSCVGAGWFGAGIYYEPTTNWDWDSFVDTTELNIMSKSTVGGHPQSTAIKESGAVAIGFKSPGLDPDDGEAFTGMMGDLGRNSKVLITFDPTNEVTRSSGIYTLKAPPGVNRRYEGHDSGYAEMSLDLEKYSW